MSHIIFSVAGTIGSFFRKHSDSNYLVDRSYFSQIPKDILVLVLEKLRPEDIITMLGAYPSEMKGRGAFVNHAIWEAAQDNDLFPTSMTCFDDIKINSNLREVVYRYIKNDHVIQELIKKINKSNTPNPHLVLQLIYTSVAIDRLIYLSKIFITYNYEVYLKEPNLKDPTIVKETVARLQDLTKRLEPFVYKGNEQLPQFFTFINRQINSLPIQTKYFLNLTMVSLEHNNLRYFPLSLLKLKKLKKLCLNNNLVSTIPNEIDELKNLIYFDMSYNRLAYLPNTFVNLTNLESLYLLHNFIRELPKNWGKLQNLKNFMITQCKHG